MSQVDNDDLVLGGIIATGIAGFFGTIDTIWLKSYNWDIPSIPSQPNLAFFTIFAAIGAIGLIVAISCFTWALLRNGGTIFSFFGKVSIATWRVLITAAVIFLLASKYGVVKFGG